MVGKFYLDVSVYHDPVELTLTALKILNGFRNRIFGQPLSGEQKSDREVNRESSTILYGTLVGIIEYGFQHGNASEKREVKEIQVL